MGRYKTTTITAALRTNGLCATALLDGPTNGTRFRSYVTETMVPVLQPGDIVVMDNRQPTKSLVGRTQSRPWGPAARPSILQP